MTAFHYLSLVPSVPSSDASTAITSLIVGLITASAALGGVLVTQRGERRRAALDRQLQRVTTSATLRASLYQGESESLRAALAEHLNLTYSIDAGYRHAMNRGLPWPGEMMEIVDREDRLFNLIRLLLDDGRESHRQLLAQLDDLRDSSSKTLWIYRRDAVVKSAVKALRVDESQIIDLLTDEVR